MTRGGDRPSIELKGCETRKSGETLPERNDPKLELLPGRGLKIIFHYYGVCVLWLFYVTHLRLGGGRSASSALSPLGRVSMFSMAVSVVGSVVSTSAPINTNTMLHSLNSILTYLWPLLPR